MVNIHAAQSIFLCTNKETNVTNITFVHIYP